MLFHRYRIEMIPFVLRVKLNLFWANWTNLNVWASDMIDASQIKITSMANKMFHYIEARKPTDFTFESMFWRLQFLLPDDSVNQTNQILCRYPRQIVSDRKCIYHRVSIGKCALGVRMQCAHIFCVDILSGKRVWSSVLKTSRTVLKLVFIAIIIVDIFRGFRWNKGIGDWRFSLENENYAHERALKGTTIGNAIDIWMLGSTLKFFRRFHKVCLGIWACEALPTLLK